MSVYTEALAKKEMSNENGAEHTERNGGNMLKLKRQNFLAALCSFALAFALVPATAFAQGQNDEAPGEQVPDEATMTYVLPFTKTVEQTGAFAPEAKSFSLEAFDVQNASPDEYAGVTFESTIETNGTGSYEGYFTFSGPASQVAKLLSRGFSVREVNDGAVNWQYSDNVYRIVQASSFEIELGDYPIFRPEISGEVEEGYPAGVMIYQIPNLGPGELADDSVAYLENMQFTNKYKYDGPTVTYTIPLTKTVKQAGSVEPSAQDFSFELFNVNNSNENEYADVTCSATVATNGAGDYEGTLVISGPFKQVMNLVDEGFSVREVNDGVAGWEYSDAAYRITAVLNTDYRWYGASSVYGTCDDAMLASALKNLVIEDAATAPGDFYEPGKGTSLEKMAFTNTYTKDGAAAAGKASTLPQTGDMSMLWLAGLLAGGAVLIAVFAVKRMKGSL